MHFNVERWWNKDLCMQYVKWVRKQYPEEQDLVLVWDSGPGQTDREVLDWCWDHKLRVMVVPGGCTGICQPLDVLVMKPFKVYYSKQYKIQHGNGNFLMRLCVRSGCERWDSRMRMAM